MRKYILFAIICLLLALPVAMVHAAPPPDGPPGLERAIAAQEAHTDRLLGIPGIVGTGVGLNPEGKAAVKILTERAGIAGLPKSLDGIPVEVVVTGMFHARQDPTARQDRPVPIGVSTGHPDITAGTIGARVKDVDGPNVYALSNNHVYANENNANLGDSALQPGTYDGGTDPADKIGELYAFMPIDFSGGENIMDAAIAISSTDNLSNATLPGGYGVPGSVPVDAYVGQAVQKYGRTTGLTQGTVSAINVEVNVCYDSRGVRCFKSAKFVNQIMITPGTFSDGGDSGSLIVTDDEYGNNNPVGLLFAGSSSFTLANPIIPVLNQFGVAIDSEPANAAPTVSITNPADGSNLDSGATILFEGTASDTEDGDLTASLVWTSDLDGQIGTGGSFSTTLSDGSHTITASVTDSGGKTGNDSISITLGTQAEPTTVSVASITYTTEGGRSGDRHLLITITLVDDFDSPVANASVSIDVKLDGSLYESEMGTTGTYGTVTFKMTNALSGTYTTEVTDVTAAGLKWDFFTPPNSFEKY